MTSVQNNGWNDEGAVWLTGTQVERGIDLKDLSPEELKQLFIEWGEPAYRARQLMEWMYQHGVTDFAEMTNLSKALRERLAAEADLGVIRTLLEQQSQDGTRKFLFQLADGVTVESVLIPDGDRLTACISSQAGCGIGCSFCATALGGLIRNLRVSEIIDQLLRVREAAGARIDNVVMMGMGEPLANYRSVLQAIRTMIHPQGLGIGQRHITISTSGVVPAIRRLAHEGLQTVLAVSLHAPTDELRDQLVPLNKKYPIDSLLEACSYYVATTGRRVTFEYVLIRDVNDSDAMAERLAALLRPIHSHVNLIPLNPVPETGYERPLPTRVQQFATILQDAGLPVTVRKEKGTDIDAACGQLRRQSRHAIIPSE